MKKNAAFRNWVLFLFFLLGFSGIGHLMAMPNNTASSNVALNTAPGSTETIPTGNDSEAKKPETKKPEAKKAGQPKGSFWKLSGDLSHRFWVKSDTEDRRGREAIRTVFAERIRLSLEKKTKDYEYKASLSTLDNSRLTASLISLSRETDHVLKIRDFQFVNFYGQKNFSGKWKLRVGRTQVPILKYKSEMLWDNDIYWDGIWAEGTMGKKATAMSWHGGTFEIHRDLRFRGSRLNVLGVMGLPKRGKTQLEWRVSQFDYDIGDKTGWANTLAPDYRTINLYGAVEWPNQIRFTTDWSRNTAADAAGCANDGGDGLNLTLVLGKMKRDFRSQVIWQYLQVGPHAVPGAFVSYDRRVNMQGHHFTYKFRVSSKTDVQLDFMEWSRMENRVATDKRYTRWETTLNHRF